MIFKINCRMCRRGVIRSEMKKAKTCGFVKVNWDAIVDTKKQEDEN
jgi:hypothetical protein